jgi:hypothetical protein
MDNRYFNNNCPPIMQDVRFITNYSDKRLIDQQIKNINKIDDIYLYKQFLQQNAENIMNNERKVAMKLYTCSVNCNTPLSKLR